MQRDQVGALKSTEAARLLGISRWTLGAIPPEVLPRKRGFAGSRWCYLYEPQDLRRYAVMLETRRWRDAPVRPDVLPAIRQPDLTTPIETLRSAILWEIEQAMRMFAEPAKLKRVA